MSTVAWELVQKCGIGLRSCVSTFGKLRYRLSLRPTGEADLESNLKIRPGDLHYIKSRIRLTGDIVRGIVVEGEADGLVIDGAFIQPRRGREEKTFEQACISMGGEYVREGEYELCIVRGQLDLAYDYATARVRIDNVDIVGVDQLLTTREVSYDPYYPEARIKLSCIDKPCIVAKHRDKIILL